MIKVGIVGATGYTGVELLRLLVSHPGAEVVCVTSRQEAGKPVAKLFPNLRHHTDMSFADPASAGLDQCDVVFFATPNGVAMSEAKALLDAGAKVIDLSADFRLKDINSWEKWYGLKHASPELVSEAVYGLPETNRDAVRHARLIANPGCYPTATQLGFLPLLAAGIVDHRNLIADVKSGVSGAGRKAEIGTLFCEAGDSMRAYAVNGHRHHPEICQGLSNVCGESVGLTFTPHLTPMIRGIHATLYARLINDVADLRGVFASHYGDEPFVDVLPEGDHPETRSVRGTNLCRIGVFRPQQGDIVVVCSVIDNLAKGAASQAIQNMNLMFGLDETTGLMAPGLMP